MYNNVTKNNYGEIILDCRYSYYVYNYRFLIFAVNNSIQVLNVWSNLISVYKYIFFVKASKTSFVEQQLYRVFTTKPAFPTLRPAVRLVIIRRRRDLCLQVYLILTGIIPENRRGELLRFSGCVWHARE